MSNNKILDEAHKEISEFCAIGDRIVYLGAIMVVYAVEDCEGKPCVKTNYACGNFVIHSLRFDYSELPALKAEHNRAMNSEIGYDV